MELLDAVCKQEALLPVDWGSPLPCMTLVLSRAWRSRSAWPNLSLRLLVTRGPRPCLYDWACAHCGKQTTKGRGAQELAVQSRFQQTLLLSPCKIAELWGAPGRERA